jgi:hypothetical protein
LLGVVNKLFVFISLLKTPSSVLPSHIKQTFPPIIWIFNEALGDGIQSRLPFEIFSTLPKFLTNQIGLTYTFIYLFGYFCFHQSSRIELIYNYVLVFPWKHEVSSSLKRKNLLKNYRASIVEKSLQKRST